MHSTPSPCHSLFLSFSFFVTLLSVFFLLFFFIYLTHFRSLTLLFIPRPSYYLLCFPLFLSLFFILSLLFSCFFSISPLYFAIYFLCFFLFLCFFVCFFPLRSFCYLDYTFWSIKYGFNQRMDPLWEHMLLAPCVCTHSKGLEQLPKFGSVQINPMLNHAWRQSPDATFRNAHPCSNFQYQSVMRCHFFKNS